MAKTVGTRGSRIMFGAILVVVAVFVVVGCTSIAKPATPAVATIAPSATASATPTPTPADVAGSLRQAHTVRTEADDITLGPGQCHAVVVDAPDGYYLPDPGCTPGAIDPAVTEATLGSTICVSGYTATVRPPTSITAPEKTASLADYGMTAGPTIEYDHLVPLELGGATSVSNLWPEPNKATARGVNNPKDAIESALKRAVCDHRVQLSTAQVAIASNWTTAESVLGLG